MIRLAAMVVWALAPAWPALGAVRAPELPEQVSVGPLSAASLPVLSAATQTQPALSPSVIPALAAPEAPSLNELLARAIESARDADGPRPSESGARESPAAMAQLGEVSRGAARAAQAMDGARERAEGTGAPEPPRRPWNSALAKGRSFVKMTGDLMRGKEVPEPKMLPVTLAVAALQAVPLVNGTAFHEWGHYLMSRIMRAHVLEINLYHFKKGTSGSYLDPDASEGGYVRHERSSALGDMAIGLAGPIFSLAHPALSVGMMFYVLVLVSIPKEGNVALAALLGVGLFLYGFLSITDIVGLGPDLSNFKRRWSQWRRDRRAAR